MQHKIGLDCAVFNVPSNTV